MFALPHPFPFRAPLAAVLACLPLGACAEDSAFSVVCPGVVNPSVVVTVVDSVSGESVVTGAGGSWTTGELSDSLRHLPGGTGTDPGRLAAYGPAGTYEVRVTRPGYPAWVRRNVEVGQGSCGPYTVELEARLVRGG